MSIDLSTKNGYLLLHPDGVPAYHNHAAYGVRCCGGLCGCNCNIRPTSWTVEITVNTSTDGTLNCVHGQTYEIELGLTGGGSPTLCGGAYQDPCGACGAGPCVDWISAGFFYAETGASLCVGMRVNHPEAGAPNHPPGWFFIQACDQFGDTAFENDCMLPTSGTSTLVILQNFAHYSEHQFSFTATPNE